MMNMLLANIDDSVASELILNISIMLTFWSHLTTSNITHKLYTYILLNIKHGSSQTSPQQKIGSFGRGLVTKTFDLSNIKRPFTFPLNSHNTSNINKGTFGKNM